MDKKEMQGMWKQARKEWKKARRELKKQWEKLTDEDIHQIDDQLDKMVELLQKRYGHTWEDATQELEEYLTDYRDRTQEAIAERLHRLSQHRQTSPWLWMLLLLGLVGLGFYWRQGNGATWQQLSQQWHKMNGESQNPDDHSPTRGPSYGAS